MSVSQDPLDRVQIATPCSASWAAMTGGERVRHCELCHKNVYNISEMSRDEALALIREKEGRLCLRLSRRSDGTILTKDCPVGIRAARRRLAYALSVALAMFISLKAFALRPAEEARTPAEIEQIKKDTRAFRDRQPGPVCAFLDWVDPLDDAGNATTGTPMMGNMAAPTPVMGAVAPPTKAPGS